jgi:hypothetical protein
MAALFTLGFAPPARPAGAGAPPGEAARPVVRFTETATTCSMSKDEIWRVYSTRDAGAIPRAGLVTVSVGDSLALMTLSYDGGERKGEGWLQIGGPRDDCTLQYHLTADTTADGALIYDRTVLRVRATVIQRYVAAASRATLGDAAYNASLSSFEKMLAV